jgi:hypothetical protein
MTTLSLRAPTRVKFGGFARLLTSARVVLEVIAEAQQMAREAQTRFHFGDYE